MDSSIPGGTTGKSESYKSVALFFYIFTPCLGGSLNGLFKPQFKPWQKGSADLPD